MAGARAKGLLSLMGWVAAAALTVVAAQPAGAVPASGPRWVPVTAPGGTTGWALDAVSCHSSTMCMAVGEIGSGGGQLAGNAVALLWNGQHLVTEAPYNPSGSDNFLQGVSCPTATFCMAVGSSAAGWLAEDWNGTTWSPVAFNGAASSVYVRSVSCPTRHRCFAAGRDGTNPVVAEWTGGSFSPVATQAVNARSGLQAVSCSGATCLAAGTWSNAASTKYGYIVERSTGSGFHALTVPNLGAGTHGDPWAVSCASASFCAITGEQDTKTAYQSLGAIYEAGQLKVTPTPDPTHNTFPYNVLYGVSCLSKTDCWTAGQGGAFSFGGPNPTSKDRSTIAASWNGRSWTVAPSKNPGRQPSGFEAVSCASATSCAAVGHVTSSATYDDLPLFEVLQG